MDLATPIWFTTLTLFVAPNLMTRFGETSFLKLLWAMTEPIPFEDTAVRIRFVANKARIRFPVMMVTIPSLAATMTIFCSAWQITITFGLNAILIQCTEERVTILFGGSFLTTT